MIGVWAAGVVWFSSALTPSREDTCLIPNPGNPFSHSRDWCSPPLPGSGRQVLFDSEHGSIGSKKKKKIGHLAKTAGGTAKTRSTKNKIKKDQNRKDRSLTRTSPRPCIILWTRRSLQLGWCARWRLNRLVSAVSQLVPLCVLRDAWDLVPVLRVDHFICRLLNGEIMRGSVIVFPHS